MCNQDDVWCLELHNSGEFQEDTINTEKQQGYLLPQGK